MVGVVLTDGELDLLQRLLEKAGIGRDQLSAEDKQLLPGLLADSSEKPT